MGKISPVAAKYVINAKITIEGSVERPDVIGAVFGQTEGLLGTELELRELQRSGKVGRIEVKISSSNGKTEGTIIIPSNMDKAETAIIGASLETIERIGPCNSKVHVEKIEDVRISKRTFVLNRAKELLKEFQNEVMPDSQELTEEVAESVRMMEISSWGREKLAAGPNVEDSEEIILVEGRADVLNLLKCGIKNVIAMNGTSVPKSLIPYCKTKTVTAFVDGDRGGNLIIKDLMQNTEIDYVTRAPDGKEVEELTKKEIHIALRNKVAAQQVSLETVKKPTYSQQKKSYPKREHSDRDRKYQRSERSSNTKTSTKDKGVFKEMLDDLTGTRGACILDKSYKVLGKVPTSELVGTIAEMGDAYAVVFDGEVNRDIQKAAEKGGISYIIGMTSKVRSNEKVKVLKQSDL